jgi:hypothetical protein
MAAELTLDRAARRAELEARRRAFRQAEVGRAYAMGLADAGALAHGHGHGAVCAEVEEEVVVVVHRRERSWVGH